jgi:hypothetical protein
MKRVLLYLLGSLDFGLHLRFFTSSCELMVYTDVDWAGYPDTCRSTSGYVVFLSDNLVSWSSEHQNIISRSRIEAEYRAVPPAPPPGAPWSIVKEHSHLLRQHQCHLPLHQPRSALAYEACRDRPPLRPRM